MAARHPGELTAIAQNPAMDSLAGPHSPSFGVEPHSSKRRRRRSNHQPNIPVQQSRWVEYEPREHRLALNQRASSRHPVATALLVDIMARGSMNIRSPTMTKINAPVPPLTHDRSHPARRSSPPSLPSPAEPSLEQSDRRVRPIPWPRLNTCGRRGMPSIPPRPCRALAPTSMPAVSRLPWTGKPAMYGSSAQAGSPVSSSATARTPGLAHSRPAAPLPPGPKTVTGNKKERAVG